MMLSVVSRCLAIVLLIQEVRGYPTGAPPEGCRSMLPGHGVPAQTGTTNPYTIMTDRTDFSCPGDQIRVMLSGEIFRGFLCQPIPNTGNLIQDIRDPVRKQNKCGQMATFTHVDNLIKSSISFLWKPQTTQTVYIACTVVQSKYSFWVNVTSPVLNYRKRSNCNRAAAEQEVPEPVGTNADRTPERDVTNNVINTGIPSNTAVDTGPENRKDTITDPETTRVDTNLDKRGKVKETITDPDMTEADRKDDGHKNSGVIFLVLCMAVCVMYL